MPQVSGHPERWPCWIELATPNLTESQQFYGRLFGWDFYVLTLTSQGELEVFTLGGIQGPEVASARALADDTQPASWTCWFRSDDLEDTIAAVLAAGGLELAEPDDVADLGRFALCADSQGADFAVWNPYHLAGAGVVDEPSAPCWIELAARDVAAARRFYHAVFGWRPVDRGGGYTEFRVGEQPMAGLLPLGPRRRGLWPKKPAAQDQQRPAPYWMPYFEVADCDDAAARAVALGATVQVAPTDVPPGRFAILSDPRGARLGLITPNDPEVRDGFRRPA
ncbi:VOC family protein [Actinomadura spongiicola]|nr:VOC family protein [Actinomadura spongiicola]